MKIKILFLATMIILLCQNVFSQVNPSFSEVPDSEPLKTLIINSANETNSISSEFLQEKHLTMMEEVLVSQGRFLFEKENKVRWEYTSPINYAIIINKNRFNINNDGKISSFDTESNRLFREINNMIVMAIQGNFVNDPGFVASFYENNKYYLAALAPQDELMKNLLETIEIFFQKEDMAVAKVKFIEPEGDYTLIKFNNRQKNTPIDEDQFSVN